MNSKSATPEQRVLIDVCLVSGIPFFWQSPGTLLIMRSRIEEVLHLVEAAGEVVLGLEGFELDSAVHPRMDLIFDVDRGGENPDPIAAVSAWSPDVWIDVTLKSRDRV